MENVRRLERRLESKRDRGRRAAPRRALICQVLKRSEFELIERGVFSTALCGMASARDSAEPTRDVGRS